MLVIIDEKEACLLDRQTHRQVIVMTNLARQKGGRGILAVLFEGLSSTLPPCTRGRDPMLSSTASLLAIQAYLRMYICI